MKYSSLMSAACLLAMSSAGMAQSLNGTLGARVVIGTGCSVTNTVTAGLADFGTVDFGTHYTLPATNVDADNSGGATSGISVQCSTGQDYGIAINGGANYTTDRRMSAGGTDYVTYSLFQEAARTTPWPVNTPVARTGTGAVENIIVYGRIAGGHPAVANGTYVDTLNVTLSW
jgi:spore coat protein U-like protein